MSFKSLGFLHPLLLGIFPILFLYTQNSDEMGLGELWLPLAVVAIVVLFAVVIVKLFFKGSPRAYLALSFAIILFYSYGQLISLTEKLGLGSLADSNPVDYYILPLWLILGALVIWFVARRLKNVSSLTMFLNVVAVLLVGFQVIAGCKSFISTPGNYEDLSAIATNSNDSSTPDIYYIILDGYGRADVLSDLYGLQDLHFVDQLRQRGFYVADSAYSNYGATDQSLASSLNLDYIQALGQFDPNNTDRGPLLELYANNRLLHLLKERGYRIVDFENGIVQTRFDQIDDMLSAGLTLSAFQNSLISMTPLAFVGQAFKSQFDLHRDQVEFTLHKLPDLANLGSPKFVMGHIISPHPPFVFEPNGEKREVNHQFSYSDGSHYMEAGGTVADYREGYAGQVRFISREILKTIDQIMANSKSPPIIIVQGDHGPGSGLNWQNAGKSDLPERFSILNAYYLPGVNDSELTPDISPVNSFRVVLNDYFGANLELLPNLSYFTARSRPYLFIDITQYRSRHAAETPPDSQS